MTLKECYEIIGGDYEGVFGRFRKEELVRKFALKFPNDPAFYDLCAAMEAGNGEEAFRAAHTLKGVCQNLGFDMLYRPVYELTELLRGCEITDESCVLFEKVKVCYEKTTDTINKFKDCLTEC